MSNPGSTGAAVGAPTYHALPYGANMADFGSGQEPGGYAKDATGWVKVKGLAAASAAILTGVTLATLPAGFRPTGKVYGRGLILHAGAFYTCVISCTTGGVLVVEPSANVPNIANGDAVWFDVQFQQAN